MITRVDISPRTDEEGGRCAGVREVFTLNGDR